MAEEQGNPERQQRERRPAGPTRREILDGVRRELELAGIESFGPEAERVVASALGLSRSDLTTEGATRVDPSEAVAVARAVGRRLAGEPLQHIEGSVEFRTVRLVSDRRALIPRPETEQLLDRVRTWASGRPVRTALDVGTGSGAIALAMLAEGIAEHVVGLDISAEALSLAGENAGALTTDGFEPRACGPEIWSAVEAGERFDLIVSNPPYVTTAEWAALDPTVRDHEPRVALDGGADGLDVIRRLAAGAAAALAEGGALFIEIGAAQGDAVRAILEAEPGLTDVRIDRDLTDRTRFAQAAKSALP